LLLETREVQMRYAPGHNEATRERILEAASRLFQEHGIAAVGLAKIMAEADLTVGTFYTHFKSKEALLRETLLRTLRGRRETLEQALRRGDLEMLVRAYLSAEHRDAAGTGCPVATLASEVGRHPRATRQTFVSHLEPSLDMLAGRLSMRRGKVVGREDAAAFMGLLVGTLQLARATPDRAESSAILEAGVRAALRLAG
jgi:TetR/AcrR family transcriptional regulator, transcriptional repressor for nem operon